jgi:LuxR family maltose regulon positive regulatory protein
MPENTTMSEPAQPAAALSPSLRLLRTKLYVPRSHPDLVVRDRLARRLDEGHGCRLTLLSAPAGFGKTTLLADWLQRRGLRPAWLSLDAGDNEPIRFWAYVIAALDGVHGGLGQAAADLLRSPQPPPIEAILTDLTNEIAALLGPPPGGSAAVAVPARLILVLDDYHAIQAPAIHQGLEFFLLNLPPQMRMIVASREDPPLPLALLRARRELLELRAQDLRFTAQEAADLLNTCMGLGLSGEDLAALDARTEGWAAGLQLAALSMQGVDDVAGFIRAFAGSHRYVFDYLAQEVLERQPAPVREFLLHTAILDRLSGPLCDAVTGNTGGQEMLERLEEANLFLLPLDQDRHWYRYHHLFAEFLRLQLEQTEGAERIAGLQRRASAWYEGHGLVEAAVRHTLRARDYEHAVGLIEGAAVDMFVRSELVTLCEWLAALPDDAIAARPRLSMLYAWALVATGHAEEAEHWAQAIERAVGASVEALAGEDAASLAPQVRAALVEVSILRGSLAMGHGDLRRVLELMERALPYLAKEGQPYLFNTARGLRPAALFTLAVAQELGGSLEQASQTFAEAATFALEEGNQHIFPMALSHRAELQVVQGQLHRAEKTYLQALEAAETMTERASPLAGMAYVGLGRLLYEWNELEDAEAYLVQGLALARPWMNWDTLVPGYLTLARLKRAQGDVEGASEALAAFDELEGMPLPPQAVSHLGAHQALFQAEWGDAKAAARWAEGCTIDPLGEIPLSREGEAVILARVWIAQGRLDDAAQLLDRLLAQAEGGGRTGEAIEIRVLQAMVLNAQGQAASAGETLCQALIPAEPEGWVRTFVDEGAPMAELLSHVGTSCVPGYVARLSTAFAPRRARSRSAAEPGARQPQPLVEPLTDRELEVLRLLAEGLTNQEIAGHLIISVNTVKTHVKNLYSKLGTGSRTQAVARGRELGLLSG